MTLGSLLVPLLLGIGLGDLLNGLPIDSSHEFTGNFFDLLTPYGLWTGVTLLGLCLLHGATFIKLRTTDELRERARAVARPLGWAAIALVVGLVIWTRSVAGGPDVPRARRGPRGDRRRSSPRGWHRPTTTAGPSPPRPSRSPRCVGSIFIDLYPNVMVSSTECRLQPDRQQLRLRPLRARRDDGRRRDLLPARAGLPGLVVPRVPRACHRRPGDAGFGSAESPAPPASSGPQSSAPLRR